MKTSSTSPISPHPDFRKVSTRCVRSFFPLFSICCHILLSPTHPPTNLPFHPLGFLLTPLHPHTHPLTHPPTHPPTHPLASAAQEWGATALGFLEKDGSAWSFGDSERRILQQHCHKRQDQICYISARFLIDITIDPLPPEIRIALAGI